MKNILYLLVLMSLVVSLTACGGNETEADEGEDAKEEQTNREEDESETITEDPEETDSENESEPVSKNIEYPDEEVEEFVEDLNMLLSNENLPQLEPQKVDDEGEQVLFGYNEYAITVSYLDSGEVSNYSFKVGADEEYHEAAMTVMLLMADTLGADIKVLEEQFIDTTDKDTTTKVNNDYLVTIFNAYEDDSINNADVVFPYIVHFIDTSD